MKLWTTALIAGACLTLAATTLLAQPADGPGDRGGRMERRGPADREAPADRPAPGERAAPADRAAPGERDRQRDGAPTDGKEGRKPPMPPMGPLMMVLDTNKDGMLSAEEIAAAPENLKKLDKNGDGKIDRVELLPPRPRDKQGDKARGPQDGKGPREGASAQDAKGPRDGASVRDGKGPRDGASDRGGEGARDGDRRPPQRDAAPDGQRPGPRDGDRRPPVPPDAPPAPPAAPQE